MRQEFRMRVLLHRIGMRSAQRQVENSLMSSVIIPSNGHNIFASQINAHFQSGRTNTESREIRNIQNRIESTLIMQNSASPHLRSTTKRKPLPQQRELEMVWGRSTTVFKSCARNKICTTCVRICVSRRRSLVYESRILELPTGNQRPLRHSRLAPPS